MSSKNKAEIRIHGKEYTIRGVESEEYMQRVAHYIDKKMADISRGSVRMSTATTSVLTAINVADDYFKLQQSVSGMKQELENKTKEVEKLNKDINDIKVKYTQTQLELAKVKRELEELKKRR